MAWMDLKKDTLGFSFRDPPSFPNNVSLPNGLNLGCQTQIHSGSKLKKSVLVEGRIGSMFIAELIGMNLLHILNLGLTKLKLLPIKTTLNIQ